MIGIFLYIICIVLTNFYFLYFVFFLLEPQNNWGFIWQCSSILHISMETHKRIWPG